MRNFILFLIVLPLLISCGNNENWLGSSTQSDQTNLGSRGDKRTGRDNKKDTNGRTVFYFTTGETKEQQKPKVVVFISVDTTNSMKRFLTKRVASSFKGFTPALSPLNWIIIFVKADGKHWLSTRGHPMRLEYDGRLLQTRQLTPNMENHESIFIDTLRLHTYNEYLGGYDDTSTPECELSPGCQWGWNEKPIMSLHTALMKNKSPIEEADAVVSISITDSDEGIHSKPEKKMSAKDLHTLFKKMYNKPLRSYGIIMKKGEPGCLEQLGGAFSEGVYSVEVAKLAEETGGANFSLCDKSYIPLAKKIVSDVQKMK